MKTGKLVTIIQVVLTSITFSQTYIPPGDVSGTWLLNDSPFYIQGDITIPDDSTLLIEPDVLVVFQGHYALNVQGRLLAIGTETSHITFTRDDTTGFHNPDITQGGWNGIQFIDTPNENDTSKIIYCILQYGKAVGSNPPDNSGGAIFVQNFSKIIISNSLITHNSAGGTDSPSGGGVSLHFANINLRDNIISDNYAWDGGGIKIWECNPVFNNNSFMNNSAGQAGGGIWIGGVSNTIFNGDNISYNTADVDGGGVICWQPTNTIFNYVDFSHNAAYNGGGAIFIECEAQFNWCNVSDNSAGGSGGGIFSDMSTIEVNNTTLERDTSSLFGGAIFNSNSSVNINDCNLINNGTVIRGGAIHSTFSTLNISNTTFERDTANIFGGAIATEHTEMFLNNCHLIDNSARILGGGIHSDNSTISTSNTTFERDTSGDSGGAIFTWQCQLNVSNCIFFQNSATYRGGAISMDSTLSFFYNNTFQHNRAIWGGAVALYNSDSQLDNSNLKWNTSEHGGAFMCDLSALQFKNIFFEENISIWGGAISSYNCSLQIDSCFFKQNSAENQGGALEYIADTTRFISISQLEITNSRFEENSASMRCGVALIEQYNSSQPLTQLMIDNCEFVNNSALRIGVSRVGNISDFTVSNSKFTGNSVSQHTAACTFVQNSNGYIYNCLFENNIAGIGTSGGAGVSNFSNVGFMNCTFVNNSSGSGGGIQLRTGSKVTLTNSILWGNLPDQISLDAINDTSSCSLYSNYNDIQYGVDSIHISDTISVVNWGVGNIDDDPLFVDTLNNDFHLQDSSPCIAAGIDSIEVAGFWHYCPSTDIEGNPRPNPTGTKPDMGAYESQFPVRVGDEHSDLSINYALFQNYPNPFNPITKIKFQIPEFGFVNLKVYDVLGNEVMTLVNEYRPAGNYEVEFDGHSDEGRNLSAVRQGLSSGVYFYQLKISGPEINSGLRMIQTKKMLLLK